MRKLVGLMKGCPFLIVSGAIIGFLLLGIASPPVGWAAPEKTKIKITHAVTSLAFIQSYIAQTQGFFKDEGFEEVELITTRGGGPDVQAVLAGDAEFTVNDGLQILPAVAKGKKLMCVLATQDRVIINVTMYAGTAKRLRLTEKTPYAKKAAALRGLKIGITRPGAMTWQLARFTVAKAGMDPDKDAEIVGLGGGAAVAAGLEQGSVDVIYISVPLGEKVVARGKGMTFIDNARGEDPNLKTFFMEGVWVLPSFIKENPNTVSAAVRALKRASDWVLSNPPERVADALEPILGGLGKELLVSGVQKVVPAISKTGRYDNESLRTTQDVLVLNGYLKQRFKLNDLFTDRFLK
jgi:NitT/TauT family transport system substrate-binding protein